MKREWATNGQQVCPCVYLKKEISEKYPLKGYFAKDMATTMGLNTST